MNGDVIPNHGYVNISDIGYTDDTALLCHTNRPPFIFNSGGNWFAPDGTRVSGYDVPGFYRNRGPNLVRLKQDFHATPAEGIFHCVISDSTGSLQTVYVGLYNNEGGN